MKNIVESMYIRSIEQSNSQSENKMVVSKDCRQEGEKKTVLNEYRAPFFQIMEMDISNVCNTMNVFTCVKMVNFLRLYNIMCLKLKLFSITKINTLSKNFHILHNKIYIHFQILGPTGSLVSLSTHLFCLNTVVLPQILQFSKYMQLFPAPVCLFYSLPRPCLHWALHC